MRKMKIVKEKEIFNERIITRQKKKNNSIKNYILSLVSSIKQELSMNFPNETSEFYIYIKYYENDKILKIFVSLLRQTKINYREMNINFVIIINEEYPNKPPLVFCLTDVNNKHLILFFITSSLRMLIYSI